MKMQIETNPKSVDEFPLKEKLCMTSLLLPSSLPIEAQANLRLLYSLLNKKHINYLQVLGFLSFPYFSCACSLLSV
jgi:hypothetical protein